MNHLLLCGKQNSEYAPFVGQPMLAAPGFKPALFGDRKRSPAPEKPPARRLQARLSAPQQRQAATKLGGAGGTDHRFLSSFGLPGGDLRSCAAGASPSQPILSPLQSARPTTNPRVRF